jgi:nitroreductase
VDTLLAIASRRDERRYEPDPLPDAVVARILDAGRLAGSASNRQPWTFVLPDGDDRRKALAPCVFAPDNVRGAGLVVAVVVSGKGPVSFDAGRAAQNMMLAAWNDGVGSCPNGIADAAAMGDALGLTDDDHFAVVLSFGYPARDIDPESRTPEEWIERADRKALDEVVERR